jgi:iron complex transport system ATP-binding protein
MSVLALHAVAARLGGRTVLRDVSAAFRPGEITAVVGPNGAGKSTLLSLLAGLRRPSTGRATIDGEVIADLPDRKRARRVGYLPQIAEIAWPLEVRSLIALGLTPWLGARGPDAGRLEAVETVMRTVGVADLAERPVDTLSGGEQARVLLARAMVGEPEWLLADEPLAGLDPAHVLEVCDVFREVATETRGVILTLHDLTAAWRLADRILVLADGGVVADGAPAEALTPPVLARAYGVEARLIEGPGGRVVDVIARSPTTALPRSRPSPG